MSAPAKNVRDLRCAPSAAARRGDALLVERVCDLAEAEALIAQRLHDGQNRCSEHIGRVFQRRTPVSPTACKALAQTQFRVERIPSYKAHRVEQENPSGQIDVEEVPDDLSPQVEMIEEILDAFGICTGGAEGYEADDVIGTLAAQERRDPVIVVSGDRDLLQVVRDAPVPTRVLYLGRGLSNATLLGPVEVAERYGIPTDRAGEGYAELALLRGDPSDGLPGVPGIGAKTAATLVRRYPSWAELCAAVTDRTDTRMAPPIRSKLAAAAPYLAVVEPVVRMAQVPLAVFQPKEPTRPSAEMPSRSRMPATCRARAASSAKVIRSWPSTSWVVTVRLLPYMRSPRRRMYSMVSGKSCINPSIW